MWLTSNRLSSLDVCWELQVHHFISTVLIPLCLGSNIYIKQNHKQSSKGNLLLEINLMHVSPKPWRQHRTARSQLYLYRINPFVVGYECLHKILLVNHCNGGQTSPNVNCTRGNAKTSLQKFILTERIYMYILWRRGQQLLRLNQQVQNIQKLETLPNKLTDLPECQCRHCLCHHYYVQKLGTFRTGFQAMHDLCERLRAWWSSCSNDIPKNHSEFAYCI